MVVGADDSGLDKVQVVAEREVDRHKLLFQETQQDWQMD